MLCETTAALRILALAFASLFEADLKKTARCAATVLWLKRYRGSANPSRFTRGSDWAKILRDWASLLAASSATLRGPGVATRVSDCQRPSSMGRLSLRLPYAAPRRPTSLPFLCNSLAAFPAVPAKRYALLSRQLHLILHSHLHRAPSTFLFRHDNAASFHAFYGTSYVLSVLEISLVLGAFIAAVRSVPEISRKLRPILYKNEPCLPLSQSYDPLTTTLMASDPPSPSKHRPDRTPPPSPQLSPAQAIAAAWKMESEESKRRWRAADAKAKNNYVSPPTWVRGARPNGHSAKM